MNLCVDTFVDLNEQTWKRHIFFGSCRNKMMAEKKPFRDNR